MNIVPITGEKPPTKIPEADMRLHEIIQSHKKTENAQVFSTKLETVSRKQKNARTQLQQKPNKQTLAEESASLDNEEPASHANDESNKQDLVVKVVSRQRKGRLITNTTMNLKRGPISNFRAHSQNRHQALQLNQEEQSFANFDLKGLRITPQQKTPGPENPLKTEENALKLESQNTLYDQNKNQINSKNENEQSNTRSSPIGVRVSCVAQRDSYQLSKGVQKNQISSDLAHSGSSLKRQKIGKFKLRSISRTQGNSMAMIHSNEPVELEPLVSSAREAESLNQQAVGGLNSPTELMPKLQNESQSSPKNEGVTKLMFNTNPQIYYHSNYPRNKVHLNKVQIKVEGLKKRTDEFKHDDKAEDECSKTALAIDNSPTPTSKHFPDDFKEFLRNTRETYIKQEQDIKTEQFSQRIGVVNRANSERQDTQIKGFQKPLVPNEVTFEKIRRNRANVLSKQRIKRHIQDAVSFDEKQYGEVLFDPLLQPNTPQNESEFLLFSDNTPKENPNSDLETLKHQSLQQNGFQAVKKDQKFAQKDYHAITPSPLVPVFQPIGRVKTQQMKRRNINNTGMRDNSLYQQQLRNKQMKSVVNCQRPEHLKSCENTFLQTQNVFSHGQVRSMDSRGRENMLGPLSEQPRPHTNERKRFITEQSQLGITSNKTFHTTHSKNKRLFLNRTQQLVRRPNQRHIKGLSNFCQIQSNNVQGIKISRLFQQPEYDYAKWNLDDTNPLPLGGDKTEALTQANLEARAQIEAIQNFQDTNSLFNTLKNQRNVDKYLQREVLKPGQADIYANMKDKLKNMDRQIKSDVVSSKSISNESDLTQNEMDFAITTLLDLQDPSYEKKHAGKTGNMRSLRSDRRSPSPERKDVKFEHSVGQQQNSKNNSLFKVRQFNMKEDEAKMRQDSNDSTTLIKSQQFKDNVKREGGSNRASLAMAHQLLEAQRLSGLRIASEISDTLLGSTTMMQAIGISCQNAQKDGRQSTDREGGSPQNKTPRRNIQNISDLKNSVQTQMNSRQNKNINISSLDTKTQQINTNLNTPENREEQNEVVQSAYRENQNLDSLSKKQQPLIGVTSVKIQKSRSLKRNSDAKSRNPNANMPSIDTKTTTEPPRLSVFRKSFDGRKISVQDQTVEVGDRRSPSHRQGSTMRNEDQSQFELKEMKNKEGGTQVNYGSVSGIQSDELKSKKASSHMKEQSVSDPKNPLMEQQISALNSIAHKINPSLVQKNQHEPEKEINFMPGTLKGFNIEFGKVNELKVNSQPNSSQKKQGHSKEKLISADPFIQSLKFDPKSHVQRNAQQKTDQRDLKDQVLKEIQTEGRVFPDCFDFSQESEIPLTDFKFTLEEMIGSDNMNLIETDNLQKPFWLYHFRPKELQKLLGDIDQEEDKDKRFILKFSPIIITNVSCKNGMIKDNEPIVIPFSQIPKLYFLQKQQLLNVISKCFQLKCNSDNYELCLDQERLRAEVSKTKLRKLRDEYYFANLDVKVSSVLQDTSVLQDSFTVQIRMPCIEVLSEIPSGIPVKNWNPKLIRQHFKTTVAHFVTSSQMLKLIQEYQLFEWMDLAKELLRDRAFAVSEAQAYACKFIKFRNCELLSHVNELRILSPQQTLIKLDLKKHDIQIDVTYLNPPKISLMTKLEEKQNYGQTIQLTDLMGSSNENASITKEVTLAKMNIPEVGVDQIVSIFGDNLDNSSLKSCVSQKIKVVIDIDKGLCKLEMNDWQELEQLNEKERCAKIAQQQMMAIKQNNNQATYIQHASRFKQAGSITNHQINQQQQLQGKWNEKLVLSGPQQPDKETNIDQNEATPSSQIILVNNRVKCYVKLKEPIRIGAKILLRKKEEFSNFKGEIQEECSLQQLVKANKRFHQERKSTS